MSESEMKFSDSKYIAPQTQPYMTGPQETKTPTPVQALTQSLSPSNIFDKFTTVTVSLVSCNTVGGPWWVWSLFRSVAGQLFLQYFDAVGWVFSPVKLSPG